jgi:hypothetical protein
VPTGVVIGGGKSVEAPETVGDIVDGFMVDVIVFEEEPESPNRLKP